MKTEEKKSYEVRITDDAAADLEAIDAFISSNTSKATAQKQLDLIVQKVELLETTPNIGVVPTRFPALAEMGYRMLPVGKYWLIYMVFEPLALVEIHFVVHQRRDLNALINSV
ncbi:MAG TPA: hypothetical protein DEA44_08535 [Firmicutes bacterium]|nr:hypothetical protein [Bacillota bacterium]